MNRSRNTDKHAGSPPDEALARTTPHPIKDGSTDITEASDTQHLSSTDLEKAAFPDNIGRYRIERRLGEGGFGTVYLARDDQLQRSVAIKVPRRQFVAGAELADAQLAEARTLADLDHPNIVPIYDIGRTEEYPCFIVSKYIEGMSLREKIFAGNLSFEWVADLVATVAEALDYAHSKRVIHRDVKPANILLDVAGKPYVADFGLALTEEGFGKGAGVMGTAAYLSPEQARGEGHLVDGRSDVFSLGVVLFELLAGQQPFTGSDTKEIARHVAEVDARPPRQLDRNIPKELERICLKALAKRASERYATCRDFAEDLRHWLQPDSDDDRPQSPAPDSQRTASVSVVPKGLRSFDQHDADFFLSLLPGPRDRNGLPDSLREWKVWVESAVPDDTHRVGVIYGPSGCGKSSLVRAGLVPVLGKSVTTIVVEAYPEQTENRLLAHLRSKFPGTSGTLGLTDTLAEIRRGQARPDRRKLLIVIDQFEQWLHGNTDYAATQLVRALRQCDGVSIQCLLLVRDDFFLALSRFMALLDIPLIQGHKVMLIDLFDQAHAEKVLTAFGRAYGRLPKSSNEMKPEQAQFLTKSIESLAREGKIYPVRLALFTEMVKARPWTSATVAELGGIEGIGTMFLEQAFSGEDAPASQRIHESAARVVLESLLPDPGAQMKGHRKSAEALMKAAGYDGDRFEELTHILDSELRLITPTELGDSASTDGKYYQLSHDYLVHSVREWTLRRQKQTFQGRLHLELSDRAALWSSQPQRRFLPNWWEWIQFRLLLVRRRCTKQEQDFLQAASRHYSVRTALTLCVLVAIIAGSWYGLRVQKAGALQEQLLTADLSNVPDLIDALTPLRSHVADSLRQFAETSDDRRRTLVSTVALVKWGQNLDTDLCGLALRCEPEELLLIVNEIGTEAKEMSDQLWAVLDNRQAESELRFRAAQLLANLDEQSTERWTTHVDFVEKELVGFVSDDPQRFDELTTLLRPISDLLLEPLSVDLAEVEQTIESKERLGLLVHFLGGDPAKLVNYVVGASGWQLASVMPILDDVAKGDTKFVNVLEQIVAELPTTEQLPESREETSRRVATAAALLAAHGFVHRVQHLLRSSPLPATRAHLIDRFSLFDVPARTLSEQLEGEVDADIRVALLLALGNYPELSDETPSALLERVRSLHQHDPDPGVHSASEWLLRRWNCSEVIAEVLVNGFAPPPSAEWRVNTEGHTMIRIDARKESLVGRVFELAAAEVSNAQYEEFNPDLDGNRKRLTMSELNHPAGIVTWNHAARYCNFLSTREGLPQCYELVGNTFSTRLAVGGYRLPTEAEWELACRAGSTTLRYFGDGVELMSRYEWFAENSDGRSKPGGLLKPNRYGLFDLYGSIAEWCDDAVGDQRVVRGTGYRNSARNMTSETRGELVPTVQFNSQGFRIARTIP